jgi:hypothetical protein
MCPLGHLCRQENPLRIPSAPMIVGAVQKQSVWEWLLQNPSCELVLVATGSGSDESLLFNA